ncbi:MAG TPA: 16S rRNA (cytosine(1402)-N(4))-methyltransferase RsmH [Fimbriimonadaceae bacterium]|nr:16S rRNA (cytosine(1402)-N(4))-methyltransferase RsmH [Fimbriimonadaceae bacterium]
MAAANLLAPCVRGFQPRSGFGSILSRDDRRALELTPTHQPVMLREILEILPLRPGAVVVDGTLGLGGHSAAFLERIAPDGVLFGFEWDQSMLEIARARLAGPVEIRLIHDDFRNMTQYLDRQADAILLDLGLNSAQVDDPERGISFREEGPLDMRMDRGRGEPAGALLNRWSLKEIEQVLWDYGDERWARNIARKIVERRKTQALRTTKDLVDAILAAIPAAARDKRIHPATRSFQAIRIVVNGELEGLLEALRRSASCLAVGGVLSVLSYHSGEDRIVKTAFRDLAREGNFEEATRKPLTPGQEEIARNPRSRSAKLRAIRRGVGIAAPRKGKGASERFERRPKDGPLPEENRNSG